MGADSEQGLKEILEENHYLPQHADYSCALRAVKQAFHAGVESVKAQKQSINESLGKAINFAAEFLPDEWHLEVSVERGAGWADLYDPDGIRIKSEQPLPDSIYELGETAKVEFAKLASLSLQGKDAQK